MSYQQPDFSLPEGFTCKDCFAFSFCSGMGIATPEQTKCDYHPVRFRLNNEGLQELAKVRKAVAP